MRKKENEDKKKLDAHGRRFSEIRYRINTWLFTLDSDKWCINVLLLDTIRKYDAVKLHGCFARSKRP